MRWRSTRSGQFYLGRGPRGGSGGSGQPNTRSQREWSRLCIQCWPSSLLGGFKSTTHPLRLPLPLITVRVRKPSVWDAQCPAVLSVALGRKDCASTVPTSPSFCLHRSLPLANKRTLTGVSGKSGLRSQSHGTAVSHSKGTHSSWDN